MGQAYARSFRKYGLVKATDLLLVLRNEGRAQFLSTLGVVSNELGPAIGESDLIDHRRETTGLRERGACIGPDR